MKGLYFEDLAMGMQAHASQNVADEHVRAFAAVSGDNNPVHLDDVYAATTPFQSRIAHGILTASYISAVIGTKLPGPGAVYVSQSLAFKRPVRIGDTVIASVEVTELDPIKSRVTLACRCSVNGKTVLEGEAVVMTPRREIAQTE